MKMTKLYQIVRSNPSSMLQTRNHPRRIQDQWRRTRLWDRPTQKEICTSNENLRRNDNLEVPVALRMWNLLMANKLTPWNHHLHCTEPHRTVWSTLCWADPWQQDATGTDLVVSACLELMFTASVPEVLQSDFWVCKPARRFISLVVQDCSKENIQLLDQNLARHIIAWWVENTLRKDIILFCIPVYMCMLADGTYRYHCTM